MTGAVRPSWPPATGHWPLIRAALFLAVFALLAAHAVAQESGTTDTPLPLSVRITSPLGRTGVPGTIRIVAQVSKSTSVALQPVRFFVNETLLGEDAEGPPYSVEWVDANPFEPATIDVEVADALGRVVRDRVELKPIEVVEVTQIASVLLEATVQDANGRYIKGLDASTFRLAEDDVPQAIDLAQHETTPSLFTLLVDSSQSMSRRMDFVRLASGRLLRYLRPKDRVIVAPFSHSLGAITGPTDDLATVADAIGAIASQGGTAIMDGIVAAAKLVESFEGRHSIVLITDGYDEDSQQAFEEAVNAAQKSHATVYVIGIGGVAGISLKGERLLRQLAQQTGGKAFFPSREEDLPHVHELVASDVAWRYLITYTPTNQKTDGTWRTVSLTTESSALRVRTRPGYFAPSPPPIRPSIEFTIRDLERRYLEVAADDLVILEDGVEQAAESFQEAVGPVSIVLTLDASGSMVKATEAVKAAAASFVRALRPEDSLAVVMFSDRSMFVHDLTKQRGLALAAIEEYAARGGTALYDAVGDAMIRLKRAEGRRVVVTLTDGRDEDNPGTGPGSQRTFGDVLKIVKETGATVFAIGLGPRVDREVLDRLAQESGGEAYHPTDVAELEAEYQRIVENLRRRYVVSYTSTNSTRDGAWRNVAIATKQSGTVVESQGGYFAPEW